MTTEELRIGNYILLDGGKHKIRRDTLISILRGVSNLKPIPLTEEILLKCGFARMHESLCLIQYNINDKYRVEYDKEYSKYVFVFIGYGYNIEIKHIHQLKNLIFALCNQELEITL